MKALAILASLISSTLPIGENLIDPADRSQYVPSSPINPQSDQSTKLPYSPNSMQIEIKNLPPITKENLKYEIAVSLAHISFKTVELGGEGCIKGPFKAFDLEGNVIFELKPGVSMPADCKW